MSSATSTNSLPDVPSGYQSVSDTHDGDECGPYVRMRSLSLCQWQHMPLILVRKTFPGAPVSPETLRRCYHCRSTEETQDKPLKRCMGCNRAVYCSRECQKSAWKTHKCVSDPFYAGYLLTSLVSRSLLRAGRFVASLRKLRMR